MKTKIIVLAIASAIAIGGIFVHFTGSCPLRDAAKLTGVAGH